MSEPFGYIRERDADSDYRDLNGYIDDLLSALDALMEVGRGAQELHDVLSLPWQKDHVTEPERTIIEAYLALPPEIKEALEIREPA